MCGIVGVAGNISKSEREMFKFMLLVDQIRGFHSTGVAVVEGDDVQVVKKAVNSSDFLDMKSANKAIDTFGSKVLLGHNRAATKGAVTSTNAHPFTHGNITGVHNGTLRQQSKLPDWNDFAVDSDNIFHAINKQGVDKTLENLVGAFALVWYDEELEELNMVRNDERPLYYAFSSDKKTIFWASEPWMIVVASNKYDVKICQPEKLKEGDLLTVDLMNHRAATNIFDKTGITEKKLYVAPKTTYCGGTNTSGKVTFRLTHMVYDRTIFANVYHGLTTDGKKSIQVTAYNSSGHSFEFNKEYTCDRTGSIWRGGKHILTATSYSVKKHNPVEYDDKEATFNWDGKWITEAEWHRRKAKGCAWCSETHVDDEEVIPVSQDQFVCLDCSTQEDVKFYIGDN